MAGLRREELALVAGVSIAHYIRLEQGKGEGVSTQVLGAVGEALGLDADERTYLHHLAQRPTPCAPLPHPPPVSSELRHLLASLVLSPALLIGRHTQILDWNHLAVAVFGDLGTLPPALRTTTHLIFAGSLREMLGQGWEKEARDHAAHLRVLLGRYRDDADLAAHIDLMLRSNADFKQMWADHEVGRIRSRTYTLRHPVLGVLTLHGELTSLPEHPACVGMDLYAAEPGSDSERALKLAAGLTGH